MRIPGSGAEPTAPYTISVAPAARANPALIYPVPLLAFAFPFQGPLEHPHAGYPYPRPYHHRPVEWYHCKVQALPSSQSLISSPRAVNQAASWSAERQFRFQNLAAIHTVQGQGTAGLHAVAPNELVEHGLNQLRRSALSIETDPQAPSKLRQERHVYASWLARFGPNGFSCGLKNRSTIAPQRHSPTASPRLSAQNKPKSEVSEKVAPANAQGFCDFQQRTQ